ncbi:MAG: hypothetical protein J7L25_13575 [Deltaproteobacteria bacterium]|nr:hypothetical protein [Candidatus Tharpella aukensis]
MMRGTDFSDTGDAAHDDFDRARDKLFTLFGRHPLNFSKNLNQIRADVGKSIN